MTNPYGKSQCPHKDSSSRANGRCRICVAANRKAERAANPELVRAKDKVLQRARREADPSKYRRYENYPEPIRPEPEFCECCGKLPERSRLDLDHCHVTGIFRGWLCGSCNRGLGQLGDNLEGLARAAAYLQTAYSAAPPKAM